MSKLSIYETRWLNLVFEGKNKDYGAYQLRQESPKTTFIAFLFGLLFIGSVSGIGLMLSSFGTAPTVDKLPDDRVITVTKFLPIVREDPPLPQTVKKATPITEVTTLKDLTDKITVTTSDKADDIKTMIDPPTALDPGPAGTGAGTIGIATAGTTSGSTGTEKPTDSNALIITTALDVLPEFPGGIKKFYDYVGNNFEKPEIEETVSVFMSFVIEKDGSMTDIKVLRNPGYGLDKEAIRVLKSLRTKWKPGIKNGVPVRVLYTLPIKVTRN